MTLETDKGSTELHFLDSEGQLLVGIPAGVWLAALMRQVDQGQRLDAPDLDGNLLDLQVVYVGQSMDSKGAAQRRLLSHKTLQQVLADVAHATPYLEPWVILMEFGAQTKLSMFGHEATAAGWDASLEHWEAREKNQPSDEDRIALVEAALIRYFQPRYNKKFVNAFPEVSHGTYKFFYESDYNAVGF